MKRVHDFITKTIKKIIYEVHLSEQQQKVKGLEPILLTILEQGKTKQSIYDECALYICQNISIQQDEARLLFKILYQKFFTHYQLIKQCASLQKQLELKRNKGQARQKQGNFIFCNIEKPYLSAPLSQAVQLTTRKGLELDPLYLD